jgi:hypothetical protein
VETAAAVEAAAAAAGGRCESRRRCAWRASGLGAVFGVGARGELKTRGGSLSSEGANAAVQAERPTPVKVLRSRESRNSLILNAITTLNTIIRVHLHGKRYTRIVQFLNHHLV